ncbi:hypothetical protein, partial [Poseidonibacter lekithochrous]|uniref:hypothetical protein n=1 Tax=Poseidonibacter lekithochrous TaxID=1904463 RepID=UPI00196B78B4
ADITFTYATADTAVIACFFFLHLVHFIEKQPLLSRFSQLTDATFTLFVQSLQADRTPLGELVRKNNSVI